VQGDIVSGKEEMVWWELVETFDGNEDDTETFVKNLRRFLRIVKAKKNYQQKMEDMTFVPMVEGVLPAVPEDEQPEQEEEETNPQVNEVRQIITHLIAEVTFLNEQLSRLVMPECSSSRPSPHLHRLRGPPGQLQGRRLRSTTQQKEGPPPSRAS